MPFRLGPMELVIILIIVLVVFGVGKLPQVGEAIGKSLKGFKDGSSGVADNTTELPKPIDIKSETD